MIEKVPEKEEDAQSNAAIAGSPTSSGAYAPDLRDVAPLEWYCDKFDDQREAEFQHQQDTFALQDPYGVKGTWMRIVNFLDYHDLFAFNFSGPRLPEDQERDGVTTAEAFRLILLKLWITRIEWPDEEDEGEDIADTGPPQQSHEADEWETVAGDSTTASSPAATREADTIGEDVAMTPVPEDTEADVVVAEDEGEESRSNSTSSRSQNYETPLAESVPTSPETSTPKKKSKYPIVHFAGRSRSLHIRWDPNANSHIRGKCYSLFAQYRSITQSKRNHKQSCAL